MRHGANQLPHLRRVRHDVAVARVRYQLLDLLRNPVHQSQYGLLGMRRRREQRRSVPTMLGCRSVEQADSPIATPAFSELELRHVAAADGQPRRLRERGRWRRGLRLLEDAAHIGAPCANIQVRMSHDNQARMITLNCCETLLV